MPRGDKAGPAGMGPMTGRGAGYCAGYPVPGYMNPGPYGFGRGSGGRRGGRGYRNWYRSTGMPGWARAERGMPARGGADYYDRQPAPGEEAETLKAQSEYLKEELSDIQERIKELEKEQEKK